MRKFAIYYNNGDIVYGGGDDDELVPVYFSRKWLEAPSDGVSHVVVDSGGSEQVCKQEDYFIQMPYGEHGDGYVVGTSDLNAFLRQAVNHGSLVKFGGWTSAENYREIADKAHKDPYIRKRNV